MSERNVELIRQMAKFETGHDRDRLFALYTDDVVFRDVALDVLATGKAEVRQLLETVYAAMEGYSMTLTSAYADDNGGGAEWIMAGKHTGDFMGFPATGILGVRRGIDHALLQRSRQPSQRLLVSF